MQVCEAKDQAEFEQLFPGITGQIRASSSSSRHCNDAVKFVLRIESNDTGLVCFEKCKRLSGDGMTTQEFFAQGPPDPPSPGSWEAKWLKRTTGNFAMAFSVMKDW